MTRTCDNPDPSKAITCAFLPAGLPIPGIVNHLIARIKAWSINLRVARFLVAAIVDLIDQVEALCPKVPKLVPLGAKDDRITYVLNKVYGEDAHSTFVRRTDLLFGAGVRDADGPNDSYSTWPPGDPLFIQYFRKIKWQSGGIFGDPQVDTIIGRNAYSLSTPSPDPSDAISVPESPQGSKRGAGDTLTGDKDGFPQKKIRSTRNGSVTVEDLDESEDEDEPSPAARTTQKSKKNTVIISDDSDDSEASSVKGRNSGMHQLPRWPAHSSSSRTPGKKATRATKDDVVPKILTNGNSSSDPTALGEDGMLLDIEVQPLIPADESKMDATADIKHFFGRRGGQPKLHRNCGRQRHMGKYAKIYRQWAEKHNSKAKLEEDIQARKKAGADAEEVAKKVLQ
ncbi:hypothetical protein FB451DRAFT_1169217 [Mycena latifolia]|nr:hypothetical protein FB451DRAFT_1169217 [Mycena latifolia]